jgi:hypothetical protein
MPDKAVAQTNRFGVKLSKDKHIYAFEKLSDAKRWAGRMGWKWDEPITIVRFRDRIGKYKKDEHYESVGSEGKWLMKKGKVPARVINGIIPFTPEMMKEIAQGVPIPIGVMRPKQYSFERHQAIVEKGRKDTFGKWRKKSSQVKVGRMK